MDNLNSSKIVLKEEKSLISEDLKYHLDNDINVSDTVFRYGSNKHLNLIKEVRDLYLKNEIFISKSDEKIINSDAGEKGLFNNRMVPLDLPFEYQELNEAEYKGKEVELNKPKRGGSKKYFVYVKDSQTGNIKKVSFGAKSGGGNLAVKIKDPQARKNFADRHNCKDKKDRTKPGYWSCNLPRYAKLLGLVGGGNYYW
jgi:hypothetical protein